MRRFTTLGGWAAALALALSMAAAPVWAGAAVVAVQTADDEAADEALMNEAFEALSSGGYTALDPLLPSLRQALDRMPASYPFFAVEGDVATLRSDELSALIMASVMAQKVGTGQENISIVQASNVYPLIALILASEAVERGRYEEAVGYADRALAAQPNEPQLILERGVALHGAGRVDEALAGIDAALDSLDLFGRSFRGPMLRQRGFLLIELGRLDEAEAAYREVLEDDPDNAIAKGQLRYIESQRNGAPRGEVSYEAPAAAGND